MGNEACGYKDWWPDEVWECELPKGHEGDHEATITWATRPEDVCREQGHVWGEWQPYTETSPSLFSHWREEWEVGPTRWRLCARCKHHGFEGGKRNKTLADILLDGLYVRPVFAVPPDFIMKWRA
jgi:hypothetical protein